MSRVHRRNPKHGRRRSERPRFRWVISVHTLLAGSGRGYSGLSVRTTKPRLETVDILEAFTRNCLFFDEALARNLADATDPNASEEDLLRAATSHPTEVRANPAASLFALVNPTAWAAVLAPQPSQVGNPDKPREWFNRAARTSRMRREARRLLECPYCYADLGKEDAEYFGENDFYCCPKCKRKGCDECMPGGRGCICPECEVGDTP